MSRNCRRFFDNAMLSVNAGGDVVKRTSATAQMKARCNVSVRCRSSRLSTRTRCSVDRLEARWWWWCGAAARGQDRRRADAVSDYSNPRFGYDARPRGVSGLMQCRNDALAVGGGI